MTKISLILILVVGGTIQWATNSKQITTLKADSAWSIPLIELTKSPVTENESRCDQIDRLFSHPLPSYYQDAIYAGFTDAFHATYQVPYCDFEERISMSPVTVRPSAGLFPPEKLADGKRFNWMSANSASFDFFYRGTTPFDGEVLISLDMPPCEGQWKFRASYNGVFTSGIATNLESTKISRVDHLEPNEFVTVKIDVDSQGCNIPTDPRTFWLSVGFPQLINS